jgi:uncharacterized membrane protein
MSSYFSLISVNIGTIVNFSTDFVSNIKYNNFYKENFNDNIREFNEFKLDEEKIIFNQHIFLFLYFFLDI